MSKPFNERRLELARLLANQQGRTWGGLSEDERGKLVDAAGAAVRQSEASLITPTPIGGETTSPESYSELEALVRSHFNEPVLYTTLEIGRCIGYAEDDSDCYIVMKFPVKDGDPRTVWCTMVGGYYFLDGLKNQNQVVSDTGEQWHDLFRLDADLTRAGVPPEDHFQVTRFYQDDAI